MMIYEWPIKNMKSCSPSLIIIEMQIKATLRNNYIPTKTAKIKKWHHQVLEIYGTIGTFIHCQEYKMIQSLWKTTSDYYKVEHVLTIWPSNCTLGYRPFTPKEMKMYCPHKNLSTFDKNIVYNILETTQIFIHSTQVNE